MPSVSGRSAAFASWYTVRDATVWVGIGSGLKISGAWETTSTLTRSRSVKTNEQSEFDPTRTADLLHRLIVSSQGKGKYKHPEKEVLLANVLTILFAGHGTYILSDMPYLQACFQEAVDYSTASTLILARTFYEHFPIHIKHPLPAVLVLPKGSRLVMDLVNTFRNCYTFENPNQSTPSRWLGVPEAEISMFDSGPRADLGRKLATTETTNILA
ncbi:hypothetical protein H0H92_015533 [Tricholoma furcatifolium]|nr:hypothetical protein H0H92_015533 [Tricholoma furcatifolium]